MSMYLFIFWDHVLCTLETHGPLILQTHAGNAHVHFIQCLDFVVWTTTYFAFFTFCDFIFPSPKNDLQKIALGNWDLSFFLGRLPLKSAFQHVFIYFILFFYLKKKKRCSNELTGSTQSFMCQLKCMWTTSLPRDIHIYQFDLNVTTR